MDSNTPARAPQAKPASRWEARRDEPALNLTILRRLRSRNRLPRGRCGGERKEDGGGAFGGAGVGGDDFAGAMGEGVAADGVGEEGAELLAELGRVADLDGGVAFAPAADDGGEVCR
jgi:hypothetical protein